MNITTFVITFILASIVISILLVWVSKKHKNIFKNTIVLYSSILIFFQSIFVISQISQIIHNDDYCKANDMHTPVRIYEDDYTEFVPCHRYDEIWFVFEAPHDGYYKIDNYNTWVSIHDANGKFLESDSENLLIHLNDGDNILVSVEADPNLRGNHICSLKISSVDAYATNDSEWEVTPDVGWEEIYEEEAADCGEVECYEG